VFGFVKDSTGADDDDRVVKHVVGAQAVDHTPDGRILEGDEKSNNYNYITFAAKWQYI
jgi:hypothetical protein